MLELFLDRNGVTRSRIDSTLPIGELGTIRCESRSKIDPHCENPHRWPNTFSSAVSANSPHPLVDCSVSNHAPGNGAAQCFPPAKRNGLHSEILESRGDIPQQASAPHDRNANSPSRWLNARIFTVGLKGHRLHYIQCVTASGHEVIGLLVRNNLAPDRQAQGGLK